jgi:hypothetical protein
LRGSRRRTEARASNRGRARVGEAPPAPMVPVTRRMPMGRLRGKPATASMIGGLHACRHLNPRERPNDTAHGGERQTATIRAARRLTPREESWSLRATAARPTPSPPPVWRSPLRLRPDTPSQRRVSLLLDAVQVRLGDARHDLGERHGGVCGPTRVQTIRRQAPASSRCCRSSTATAAASARRSSGPALPVWRGPSPTEYRDATLLDDRPELNPASGVSRVRHGLLPQGGEVDAVVALQRPPRRG